LFAVLEFAIADAELKESLFVTTNKEIILILMGAEELMDL
jgi:hypothetical protein